MQQFAFRYKEIQCFLLIAIFVKIIEMDTTIGVLVIVGILMVSAMAIFIPYYREKKKMGSTAKPVASAHTSQEGTRQMQLQAYERLILLVDRIALPNLIARTSEPNLSAREMQMLLTHTIRQEFDYNITQQIYVTAEAWEAVKSLKEQNLLMINQMSNVLPADATGLQLLKLIMEFLMNDKRANLHEVVSNVLSFEAKKIM